MKACRSLHCLFWALLYCVLYLVSANEDELLDFDFGDAKDDIGNWNYVDEQLNGNQKAKAAQAQKKLESNMLDFAVEMEEQNTENQVPPFDWREKVMRNALAKTLTNRAFRQKFAEVMPILRVLSSQQRLALSALISAQMNAKQGHELKLEQVRMMFGNDKKLLLPIVFDLANLVRNSARKYINLGSGLAAAALLHTPVPIQKRNHELTLEEQRAEEDDTVGTIAVQPSNDNDSTLEDFFEEMQSEVLDPQIINEALQTNMRVNATKADDKSGAVAGAARTRRATNEFVHKLPRSGPVSIGEEDLLRGAAGSTVKLNTTAFQQASEGTPPTIVFSIGSGSSTVATAQQPSSQTYIEIEDLAFAGLNGTETELGLNTNDRSGQISSEPLPSPEELIAGPRYRFNKLHATRTGSNQMSPPIKRKRVQAQPQSRGRPNPAASSHNPVVTSPKKCERFTSNMCIRTDDYPL